MKLAETRSIVDAIHSGELRNSPTETDPVFGLQRVTRCSGVSDTVLNPREAWSDKAAYDTAARQLAESFQKNYAAVLSGRDLGAMDG